VDFEERIRVKPSELQRVGGVVLASPIFSREKPVEILLNLGRVGPAVTSLVMLLNASQPLVS
jgi:hypothetical protein